MQKIVSSPHLYSALTSNADVCSQTLSEFCPAPLAYLFASRRCGRDGQLEWWSPLNGPAIPFIELSVVEQQQLLKVLAQHQAALAHLAQELVNTDQSSAAQVMGQLLRDTDFSRLYSIAQQPVVIDWQTALPDDRLQPQANAPSAADSAAVVMAASAARSARSTAAVKPLQRWRWLLLPLLLMLGLAALWFGFI